MSKSVPGTGSSRSWRRCGRKVRFAESLQRAASAVHGCTDKERLIEGQDAGTLSADSAEPAERGERGADGLGAHRRPADQLSPGCEQ